MSGWRVERAGGTPSLQFSTLCHGNVSINYEHVIILIYKILPIVEGITVQYSTISLVFS